MKVLLDIARHIGTHPTPYGRANGRQMTETQTPYTITRNGALVDGDDMTWQTQDGDLNMWEIAKQVRDLRNLCAGLQSEIVELRKKTEAWEGD
jgi:hypothetical protein